MPVGSVVVVMFRAGITVTCASPLRPSDVATIATGPPGVSPVTRPVFVTDATPPDALHSTARPVSTLPWSSLSTALNCTVDPTTIVADGGDNVTLALPLAIPPASAPASPCARRDVRHPHREVGTCPPSSAFRSARRHCSASAPPAASPDATRPRVRRRTPRGRKRLAVRHPDGAGWQRGRRDAQGRCATTSVRACVVVRAPSHPSPAP